MKKIIDNATLVFWGVAVGVLAIVITTQDQSPEALDYMAKSAALKATSVAVAK